MVSNHNIRFFLKRSGVTTNYKHHPCLCCLFIQEVIREVDVRTVFENNSDLNRAGDMNNSCQM